MRASVAFGEELFARGKLEEARQYFLSVLEDDPEHSQALNDLGVVALTMGEERSAETYFRRAIALDADCLDARINLANLHLNNERVDAAAEELEIVRQHDPENLSVLRQLSLIYEAQGRREEIQELVGGSRSVDLLKRFIDSLWSNITYWELQEHLSVRERLEGVTAGCLAAIDGLSKPGVHFRLVADDGVDEPIALERLREAFYYNQSESPVLELLRKKDKKILTVHSPEWQTFRKVLVREIMDEGGCMGNYTQSLKALRATAELRDYDIEATIDYFRENLGPCDCHVYRGIEL
jgi:tetratricopeptide (TPR) repeat protein